jgi:hypothetical protein
VEIKKEKREVNKRRRWAKKGKRKWKGENKKKNQNKNEGYYGHFTPLSTLHSREKLQLPTESAPPAQLQPNLPQPKPEPWQTSRTISFHANLLWTPKLWSCEFLDGIKKFLWLQASFSTWSHCLLCRLYWIPELHAMIVSLIDKVKNGWKNEKLLCEQFSALFSMVYHWTQTNRVLLISIAGALNESSC